MKIGKFQLWLLVTSLLLFSSAYSQTPCNSVAFPFGSPGLDICNDVQITEDALYVCGGFSQSISFGNGISLISSGGYDIFVAKLDLSGNTIWAVRAGGVYDDRAQQIDLDNLGNIYITGEYAGTGQFGTYSVISNGSSDMFVAKLSPTGQFNWVFSGGGFDLENGRTLIVDNGYIYAAGYYFYTAQFGSFQLSSIGGNEIVILKLDLNGNLIWAHSLPGSGGDDPRDLSKDINGNIYLTGYFTTSLSFPGTSSTIYSQGGRDVFVAKFNTDGNCILNKSFGSFADDTGEGMAVDETGNLYISGYYSAGFSFNGSYISHLGDFDAFLIKYNPSFQSQWIKTGNGVGRDYPTGTSITFDGNIMISGYIGSNSNFSGTTIPGFGGLDGFRALYASDGTLLNAESYGGSGDDIFVGQDEYNGLWCATGKFENSVQINNNQTITSNGYSDLFILFSNPQPQSTNFTHTISNLTVNFTTSTPLPDSVLWDFGDGSFATEFNPQHTYASPSTYQVTLTGYFPCNTDTAMHSVQLCEPPVASFVYEPSYLLFHYNNANTVADSLRWFFGDGTTSTQNNPEHLFASPGNYTTSLVAYNNCTSDTFNVSFFACDSLASSFTFTTSGNIVSFTSTSYNYYDVFWDFGDGNTSTELNPTHEYAAGGNYIVSHYSINPCESALSTDTINICEPPISQFTADYVGDMTFAFNNLSSNYTSCIWYFGDGDSSTLVNPYHTYDSCLAYEVTLVVTNECGTATFIDTINLLTDLFETNKEPFIALSPSPSGNIEVYTQAQTKNNELYLFNTKGELIYQAHFNNSLTIPSKTYKNGIYILKILNTAGQTVYVKKIQLVR